MQFLYPPTHSQHSAYRFYDVCLPGQGIHSSLESDEKEHGSRAQRPQSRPSSSEGSNGGKVATAKYSCPYCGKGFNRPSSLKIHINSHTGEKPFICPVESCRRSFSVLSNMRRHARMHSQSAFSGP
ncbi:hypothetical protein M378DRAFT_76171 [Amanita muscaria Koide BX008]|uniref:C2H2-type domain-containing protein n=1 Tax=Amanita muscaria (strain Koide BX008) TaxID=946122 RepID=A0A0C2X9K1_AMAMK|nr:hypothetical protein M378DRAFT_76171 [Amanita muscaria Koide BX008]